MEITKDMLIGEIIKINPNAASILMSKGMGCIGCPSAQMETLEQAVMVHSGNLEELLKELNEK